METNELLLGFADLALALAGFSGLVVAVRTSTAPRWHPRDLWSLAWMLGAGMGALFMALLPIVMFSFTTPDPATWFISNLAMTGYLALCAAFMHSWHRRLSARGYPPRVPYFPTMTVVLFTASSVLNLGAVAGAVSSRGSFVLGLTISLLTSALSLVVFLIILAREAPPAERPQVESRKTET